MRALGAAHLLAAQHQLISNMINRLYRWVLPILAAIEDPRMYENILNTFWRVDPSKNIYDDIRNALEPVFEYIVNEKYYGKMRKYCMEYAAIRTQRLIADAFIRHKYTEIDYYKLSANAPISEYVDAWVPYCRWIYASGKESVYCAKRHKRLMATPPYDLGVSFHELSSEQYIPNRNFLRIVFNRMAFVAIK